MLSARFGLSFNNFSCTFVWQNWFFLAVFAPFGRRASAARAKQQERINKCARKVIEELNKSQYFQFADSTFCKTTDDIHQNYFLANSVSRNRTANGLLIWFLLDMRASTLKFSILISRHVDRLPTRGKREREIQEFVHFSGRDAIFLIFFSSFLLPWAAGNDSKFLN